MTGEIKYHPLMDADPKGTIRVPMFCTTDEKAMEHHRYYLRECIPHRYRLFSTESRTKDEAQNGHILCPYCGKPMNKISDSNGGTSHGLYLCPKCG